MTDPAADNIKDPAAFLPKAFLARVKEQLHVEFPAFLASYRRPPMQALRVNTLKCGAEELQELIPQLIEDVPGTPAGFYYPEDLRPGLSPYHEAGLYYIQEPSAMLAVPALEAQPGERVLDLCAAPGGKTTAIAADMKGAGLLIANEIIPKRAAILSQNVERLGIINAVVTNHAPAELAERFPAFFDRILVDAPCSGEGMFKKEPQAMEMWSPENVALCAARQDAILAEADKMLKPGGRLVYSTCTFSPEEDESCMDRFLASHPDYTLLSMQTVYPHRFPGEGQFVAALQKEDMCTVLLSSTVPSGTVPPASKKGRGDGSRSRTAAALKEAVAAWEDFAAELIQDKEAAPVQIEAFAAIGNSALSFLQKRRSFALTQNIHPSAYTLFGGQLYLLPQPIDLSGLKVLRPGLHLGTYEKGRFTPAHALALALSPVQVNNALSLSEQQACAWIEGLSLPCENLAGWCLVCVNGHSLGFGKVSGGQCKNHYPKGLRKKTAAL